jgi:alpha-ketoglutarate-dependent taurine dioxygenase
MADRIVPLSPQIGAKVLVRRDELFDPGFPDECMDALERHGVLVFPGIGLRDEEQVAFGESLGEVIPMGALPPDGTREATFKVTLDPREQASAEMLKNSVGWHIDGLLDEGPPPKATLLSPRRIAPSGGETEICSTYAAYSELPEAERKRCESPRIVHTLVASKRCVDPSARTTSWACPRPRAAR